LLVARRDPLIRDWHDLISSNKLGSISTKPVSS